MGRENWQGNLTRIPYFIRVAIVVILLFLPATTGYLSWTIFLIPLLVFFLLNNFEEEKVYAHITPALLAGGVLALFLRSLPAFFVAASFLPVGFVLDYAAKRQYPVWRSGLIACLSLVFIWFFGGIAFNLVLDKNLYQEIITGLDSTLVATLKMYQDSGDLAPQMALQLEEAIRQLRAIVPKIFPAIAINTAIITAWLNLLLGNWLLKKTCSGLSPWPDFRQWRLPEKLVWFLIGAGFGFLLPVPGIQVVSLNLILIFGLIYCLQGLAVLSFLMNRWEVPILFQVIVFGLILLQTYSIIFLTLLGLIDIWFNLGPKKQT